MSQFSLRQTTITPPKQTSTIVKPLPGYSPAGVPAGLNPSTPGILPGPLPKSSVTANQATFRVTNSLTYFAATNDLGQAYPDVPLGGKLDDVLHFAWAHTLPVFRFTYMPMEVAVVVYCWVAIPLCVMPLAFVYIDSSFRDSPMGLQDFFVYQLLIGMPTQMSPLTMYGGPDGLSLLGQPDSLWLPFIPPAPIWPEGQAFPPNPMLRFFRGGNVPVDGSGLAGLIGSFL